jgi:hypothetical protein
MCKISLKIERGEFLVLINECTLKRGVFFVTVAQVVERNIPWLWVPKTCTRTEVFIHLSFFSMRSTSLPNSLFLI